MEIRRNILAKFLEKAAIEQLIAEYSEKGYKEVLSIRGKKYAADLILQKGNDIIVFEIKSGKWSSNKQKSVVKKRNSFVHELGASFKIVLVHLPKEPDILIDGIEGILVDLLTEKFNGRFSELATHYWPDEISDVDYSIIHICENNIKTVGSGIITLGLQYGSDGDYERGDGVQFYKSFTFDFDLKLDYSLKLIDEIDLTLDTL